MSPRDARRHAQVSPRSKRPTSAKYQRAGSPSPSQEYRPRGGLKLVEKDLGARGQRVQDGRHGIRLRRQASIEKAKPGSPRDKSDALRGEKDPSAMGYNDAAFVPSESGKVVVAVRVRPFSDEERAARPWCIISMSRDHTTILDPAYYDSEGGINDDPKDRSMWERTFTFDHNFWSHAEERNPSDESEKGAAPFSNQADIYRTLGKFLVDNAYHGFNCSLFAYGQTGSGKTYTMLGDCDDLTTATGSGRAGLIPRICADLFRRFHPRERGNEDGSPTGRGKRASFRVSFCEIYNEQVRDLFAAGRESPSLRVREHPGTGAFVEGLSTRTVVCFQEVQHLLNVGMSAREQNVRKKFKCYSARNAPGSPGRLDQRIIDLNLNTHTGEK